MLGSTACFGPVWVDWSYHADALSRTAPVVMQGRTVVATGLRLTTLGPGMQEMCAVQLSHPVVSSMTTVDDLVVAVTLGGEALAMTADCEVRWRNQFQPRPRGGLIAYRNVVAMTFHDGLVVGVNARTGETMWRYETKGTIGFATPTSDAKMLYVGDVKGRLVAMDMLLGNVHWTFESQGPLHAGATACGRKVIVADGSGTITALARQDGAPLWHIKAPGAIAVPGTSVGEAYYAATEDAQLLVVDVRTGRLLGVHPLPGPPVAAATRWRDDLVIPTGGVGASIVGIDLQTGAPRWQQSFQSPARVTVFDSSAVGITQAGKVFRLRPGLSWTL